MKRIVELAVGAALFPVLLGVMAWTARLHARQIPPTRSGTSERTAR